MKKQENESFAKKLVTGNSPYSIIFYIVVFYVLFVYVALPSVYAFTPLPGIPVSIITFFIINL